MRISLSDQASMTCDFEFTGGRSHPAAARRPSLVSRKRAKTCATRLPSLAGERRVGDESGVLSSVIFVVDKISLLKLMHRGDDKHRPYKNMVVARRGEPCVRPAKQRFLYIPKTNPERADKNLRCMKQFYETYSEDEKLATVWRLLSRSNQRTVTPLKRLEARAFDQNLKTRTSGERIAAGRNTQGKLSAVLRELQQGES